LGDGHFELAVVFSANFVASRCGVDSNWNDHSVRMFLEFDHFAASQFVHLRFGVLSQRVASGITRNWDGRKEAQKTQKKSAIDADKFFKTASMNSPWLRACMEKPAGY
jgi:hypothetical protein